MSTARMNRRFAFSKLLIKLKVDFSNKVFDRLRCSTYDIEESSQSEKQTEYESTGSYIWSISY